MLWQFYKKAGTEGGKAAIKKRSKNFEAFRYGY
jgi:hypothetical protein